MKKAVVGADDSSPTVDAVIDSLRSSGFEVDIADRSSWPVVARTVAERVASNEVDLGVLFCWTGTGTSMMANKVRGVRAALCWDPWIAEGARKWNDANLLVMSLKLTLPDEAVAILDSWLSVTEPDPDEAPNIKALADYERHG